MENYQEYCKVAKIFTDIYARKNDNKIIKNNSNSLDYKINNDIIDKNNNNKILLNLQNKDDIKYQSDLFKNFKIKNDIIEENISNFNSENSSELNSKNKIILHSNNFKKYFTNSNQYEINPQNFDINNNFAKTLIENQTSILKNDEELFYDITNKNSFNSFSFSNKYDNKSNHAVTISSNKIIFQASNDNNNEKNLIKDFSFGNHDFYNRIDNSIKNKFLLEKDNLTNFYNNFYFKNNNNLSISEKYKKQNFNKNIESSNLYSIFKEKEKENKEMIKNLLCEPICNIESGTSFNNFLLDSNDNKTNFRIYYIYLFYIIFKFLF